MTFLMDLSELNLVITIGEKRTKKDKKYLEDTRGVDVNKRSVAIHFNSLL